MRSSRWFLRVLPLALLVVAPLRARADDPPTPAAPPPKAPPPEFAEILTEYKKDFKTKSDPKHARERAEFWETKGFKGVGLFYLGLIWEKAGDYPKAVETFEKFVASKEGKDENRESAMMRILSGYARAQTWDKALAAGELALKTYPASNKAGQNADDVGRMYRHLGKPEKAEEMFRQASESKSSQGVFDLIDMQMVAGQVDKARETCTKYGEALKASTKTAQQEMKEFLDAIGTVAPALDGAKSPTKSQVPAKLEGKWTVLFLTYLSMGQLEANLHTLPQIMSRWDVETYGVITYSHYDPFQRKVLADMTPDQELELQTKVLEKESGGAQVLLMDKGLWDGLHLKTPGQKMILDPEGKFRWIRFTHQGEYDWFCLRQALNKFVGAEKEGGGAAPAAPGGPDEGGEGGGG